MKAFNPIQYEEGGALWPPIGFSYAASKRNWAVVKVLGI